MSIQHYTYRVTWSPEDLDTLDEPSALARLIAAGDEDAWRAVIEGGAAPPSATRLLPAGLQALGLLARHPQASAEQLARLAADRDWEVREAVAGHANTSGETRAWLLNDTDEDVRAAACAGLRDPRALTGLAGDASELVREALAANHACPPVTLRALAEDPNEGVRAAVAGNANTPGDTLTALFERAEGLNALALNPFTPHAVLEALAAKGGRAARVARTRLSSVAADLSGLRGGRVAVALRRAASLNPAAPPELLSALAADPDARVRENAALHDATPEATRRQLGADGQARVRRAARALDADDATELFPGPERPLIDLLARRSGNYAVLRRIVNDYPDWSHAGLMTNPAMADALTVVDSRVAPFLIANPALQAPRRELLVRSLMNGCETPADAADFVGVLSLIEDQGTYTAVSEVIVSSAKPIVLEAMLNGDDDRRVLTLAASPKLNAWLAAKLLGSKVSGVQRAVLNNAALQERGRTDSELKVLLDTISATVAGDNFLEVQALARTGQEAVLRALAANAAAMSAVSGLLIQTIPLAARRELARSPFLRVNALRVIVEDPQLNNDPLVMLALAGNKHAPRHTLRSLYRWREGRGVLSAVAAWLRPARTPMEKAIRVALDINPVLRNS